MMWNKKGPERTRPSTPDQVLRFAIKCRGVDTSALFDPNACGYDSGLYRPAGAPSRGASALSLLAATCDFGGAAFSKCLFAARC